jgi:hypothetical protein
MVSQVKNQMIIESYGDFVRVKHVVSMRQVNPNKESRRKPNKCFHIINTTHDFFKGSLSNLSHLGQVMLQKKSLTYYQNNFKHGMQKSKPQSKQAPFVPLFCMKLFQFSNTIQTF